MRRPTSVHIEQVEDIEWELTSILPTIDALLQQIEVLEAIYLSQIHYGNRQQRTITATEF